MPRRARRSCSDARTNARPVAIFSFDRWGLVGYMTRDRQFRVERLEPGWQRIDQRDVIMTRRRRHRQSHADFRAGLDGQLCGE